MTPDSLPDPDEGVLVSLDNGARELRRMPKGSQCLDGVKIRMTSDSRGEPAPGGRVLHSLTDRTGRTIT